MIPVTLAVDRPIFLVGATGTGKSAVAMELGRRAGVAILVMDAMQVYRGVEIGTGKPTAKERVEVLHGGLDLAELDSGFDVAQYLARAAAFLREQREAGRPVIIVGGTGLYFRALTRGLCEAPQGSEELRAELNAFSAKQLRERLEKIDPAMLEQIDAANPRRLVRAIEVMEATGRSLRAWQDETPEPLVKTFRAFWIQRKKEELQERIVRRVEEMFAQGWVEEVRGLVARYGVEAVRGFAGIGYGEIANFLSGNTVAGTNAFPSATGERGEPETHAGTASCDQRSPGQQVVRGNQKLKNDIVTATRQYAKRQLTWFAREPNLTSVILSGDQSFPAALLSSP